MSMLLNISVWLIEDESAIAETIAYALTREGACVRIFDRAQPVITALAQATPQLVIADVGLPDRDGFALFREIKARLPDLPWIFLTARSEEIDRVLGLELGADDYIAKPFSLRELSARVRTILRRSRIHNIAIETEANHLVSSTPILHYQSFSLHSDTLEIYYHQQKLNLTRTEFLLLQTLLQTPLRVLTRVQLMNAVWPDDHDSMERTVDTHIKSIRAKLALIAPQHDPISTHRGVGYSLQCAQS